MISFLSPPAKPAGSLVLSTNFRERPIMCFYIYRRKSPEKVTGFSRIFSKFREKNLRPPPEPPGRTAGRRSRILTCPQQVDNL